MILSHCGSIICIRCIYCFPYMFECGCPHKYQINQLLLKRELYWFLCYLCRHETSVVDHSGDDGARGGGSGL